MIKNRLRATKFGAFWIIEVYKFEKWMRLRSLYSTRKEARKNFYFYRYGS